MPIHSQYQNVTGSVALSEQPGVLLNSGSVTGLLVGGVPVSSANPIPVSGSFAASFMDATQGPTGSIAPLSASLIGGVDSAGLLQPLTMLTGALLITGSVQVANFPAVQVVSGSNWIPTITGSVRVTNIVDVSGSAWTPTITGSVVVANQVNVTGTVGITSPVAVTQGTSPWIVSGSAWTPTITGSVVVQNQVNITGSTWTPTVTGSVVLGLRADVRVFAVTSSLVHTPLTASANVTALPENLIRAGVTIYNDSNKTVRVKLGVSASLTDYTTQMARDDYYEVPFGYTGRIDVFSPADTVGTIRVTEIF